MPDTVRRLLKCNLLVILSVSLVACAVPTISRQQPVDRSATPDADIAFDYLLYLPPAYDDMASAGESWPAVFILHGVAEIGTTVETMAGFGIAKQIEQGRDFPFVVVSPQLTGVAWGVDEVVALVEHCVEVYRIDPGRIYLTGTSLGGHAAWVVAAARPDLFAAIAPVAGWGDRDEAEAAATVPAWSFHGDGDLVIPVSASKEMYELHLAAGGESRLTVFPGKGHTVWDEVYGDDALYDWFLSQSIDGSARQGL